MRIAVISGASSGLGMEMTEQIAKKFKNLDEIWVIARRREKLYELKKKVENEQKVNIRPFVGSVEDERFLEHFERLLEKERPKVKILVNAAGFGLLEEIGECTRKEETDMIRVNCVALTELTHIVLSHMRGRALILNFASAAAFMPQPQFGIYAATKAYVYSYSRSLQMELKKRKINVCAVCPGPVATEFFDIAQKYKSVAFYKHLVMADKKKVVKRALKDVVAGKSTSVYGLSINAFRILAKLCPWSLILKIMQRM